MTARSTTAGTPVRSCMITRDGMNGISASAATPGRHDGERLDVGRLDDAAAGVAEQVLEQDPDRDRQRRRRRSRRPAPTRGRGPGGPVRAARGRRRGRSVTTRPISVRSLHSMRASVPRPTEDRPMKAWGDLPGEAAARRRKETEAAIDEAGIDLDPVPYGHHRHGDEVHADDHVASPPPLRARARRRTPGIVGAGAVGTALGAALSRAGWPIHAVASRDAGPPRAVHGARRRGARLRRAAGPRRGGRADHPGRPRRRDRARSPRASGCTAARRWSTRAARSGPRSSQPAMAAGTQIGAFHPLVAFADTERAIAALHGATVAIEGDDQLAALLSEMAERIGATRRPAGARLEGRLPRGRRPRRRWLRRPARCDRGAGRGRRSRRGRRPGDLRPADRGHAGQRPGAGHPRRADRTDDPRRRRDARAHLGGAGRPRPRRARAVRRRGPPRDRPGTGAGRAGTGDRGDHDARPSTRRLQGPTEALPLRPMGHSIAAKYAARPAARFVRPSSRARERRLGLVPITSFSAVAARQTELRVSEAGPYARLRAGWRGPRAARPRTRDGRLRPQVRDALGPCRAYRSGSSSPRRHGAVARLRTATATSAGGIVVRYEAGRPQLVIGSRRRERDGRTWTLPKGTPERGETTEETALREVGEETGLEVRITGPLAGHRVLVRPVRHAHPQDRALLPDGAHRRRPGSRTTTSSSRSAGSTSTRPRRC